MYAHRIHSGFWHDVNQPESFGFAKSQIIPFDLETSDGETLYGWHILPLDVYAKNQATLIKKGNEAAQLDNLSILQNLALEILQDDPEARVVINFHGNAGHVAQGWRTDTYRSLSAQPHTHVFTIDYRGFGKSSGSPTEAGIITDGVALADYILKDIGIHQDRIVILGQSLGTAVATAVGLHFATTPDSPSDLLPSVPGHESEPLVFAGIVLVAPFTSLPSLLLSYRIGGLIPVLAPLRPYPGLVAWVEGYILDKWHTALRLAAYIKALEGSASIASAEKLGQEKGSVQIIHARNDADIAVEQSRLLFEQALGVEGAWDGIAEIAWKDDGSPRLALQIVEHGGKLLCDHAC